MLKKCPFLHILTFLKLQSRALSCTEQRSHFTYICHKIEIHPRLSPEGEHGRSGLLLKDISLVLRVCWSLPSLPIPPLLTPPDFAGCPII